MTNGNITEDRKDVVGKTVPTGDVEILDVSNDEEKVVHIRSILNHMNVIADHTLAIKVDVDPSDHPTARVYRNETAANDVVHNTDEVAKLHHVVGGNTSVLCEVAIKSTVRGATFSGRGTMEPVRDVAIEMPGHVLGTETAVMEYFTPDGPVGIYANPCLDGPHLEKKTSPRKPGEDVNDEIGKNERTGVIGVIASA